MAKRFTSKLFFIFLIFSSPLIRGQEIKINIEAPKEVHVGEVFLLSFKINRKTNDLKLNSPFDAFKLNNGPSNHISSKVSIINGEVIKTETTKFNYSLTAKKEGRYALPTAKIKIDNVEYFSDTVLINVIEKDTSNVLGGSTDTSVLFAKLELSKNKVLKQEAVFAQLKLYFNVDIILIEEVVLPSFNKFLFYELDLPSNLEIQKETINNKTLNFVLIKKFVLIPLKSGEFNLGETKLDCKLRKPKPNTSDGFNSFFNAYKTEVVPIYADSVKLLVKDFEKETPNDFAYISGRDLQISASVEKPVVSKNEEFKYELRISGNGNLKFLNIPKINFPPGLKLRNTEYSNNLKTDSSGIHGERVFSYYLTSKTGGKVEIPAHSMSYYNLSDSKFSQISSPAVFMEVKDEELSKPKLSSGVKTGTGKVEDGKSKFASVIVMDLSASMLAQDFKPNRKTAVVNAISNYIRNAKQGVGVVTYASTPHLLHPISNKKRSIVDSLSIIDSLKLGVGTSTGLAICMALDELQGRDILFKRIILITDGASNMGTINEEMAIGFSRVFNIPVYIIGIGADAESAPVTMKTDFGEQHTTIPIRINDEELDRLAKLTGGKYFRAVDENSLEMAIKEIDELKNKKIEQGSNDAEKDFEEKEIQRIINLMYQDISEQKKK